MSSTEDLVINMDSTTTQSPLAKPKLPSMGDDMRRCTVATDDDSRDKARTAAIDLDGDGDITDEERALYFQNQIKRHREAMNAKDFATMELPRDPFAWGFTNITFKNLSFEVPDKDDSGNPKTKTIVEPCSGHLSTGSLTALMGPSGSGKTTLMDMIAGKKTAPYSGEVFCNGKPRDEFFKRMIAYVPQEDRMPQHWTVMEAIMFNLRLKTELPPSFDESRREAMVMALLRDLGLEREKDTKIGGPMVRGISGGQRRRVTLARGMIGFTQVLFCDEPTSGLSATDAEICIKSLRLIAKTYGVTIAVVIHQPRNTVAELFDNLVLLTSEPGRMVYNGAMKNALEYFKMHGSSLGVPYTMGMNPCDYFLDLVTPDGPFCERCEEPSTDNTDEENEQLEETRQKARISLVQHFVDRFKSDMAEDIDDLVKHKMETEGKTPLEILEDRKKSFYMQTGEMVEVRAGTDAAVGFRRQFAEVFNRQLVLYVFRDQAGIVTRFVMAIMKAVFIGSAYVGINDKSDDIQLGFLFMLLQTTAMAAFMGLAGMIERRDIMKLETSEGLYTEVSHIISNFFIFAPLALIENLVFTFVLYAMGGLSWSNYGVLWEWSTLVALAMDAFFSCAAAASKNADEALVKAMPFLFLFVIYNGYMVTPDSAPGGTKWLLYISPIAWSFEQIGIEFYKNEPNFEMLDEKYGWHRSDNHKMAAIFILVGMFVLFRGLEMVCLKYLHAPER